MKANNFLAYMLGLVILYSGLIGSRLSFGESKEKASSENKGLELRVDTKEIEENAKKIKKELEKFVDSYKGKKENGEKGKQEDYSYLDVYDESIGKWVNYFNTQLKPLTPIDSNLVKAMIAVESGGTRNKPDNKNAFKYDPMQIANKGDFALEILANRSEGTHLIITPEIAERFKGKKKTPRATDEKGRRFWDYSNTNMDVEASIAGGVGWLCHKAAVYGSIEEGNIKQYVIRSGDNATKIAEKMRTTLGVLKKYNSKINLEIIKPGQTLIYREAKRGIVGWKPWENGIRGYNGGGNPDYWTDVLNYYNKLKGEKGK